MRTEMRLATLSHFLSCTTDEERESDFASLTAIEPIGNCGEKADYPYLSLSLSLASCLLVYLNSQQKLVSHV